MYQHKEVFQISYSTAIPHISYIAGKTNSYNVFLISIFQGPQVVKQPHIKMLSPLYDWMMFSWWYPLHLLHPNHVLPKGFNLCFISPKQHFPSFYDNIAIMLKATFKYILL